jgi:hypothetical protein
MTGQALVIALGLGAFFGLLVLCWVVGGRSTPATPAAAETTNIHPVSMLPFGIACYVCLTGIRVAAGATHALWGTPTWLVATAPFIAVPFSVGLLLHNRALLPSERLWLSAGCFPSVWLYEWFRDAIAMFRGQGTFEANTKLVVGTIIDLILVVILVAVASVVAMRFRSALGSRRRLTIVGGAVRVGSVAAGAGRQCAPAAPIGRGWAPPQLIR